MALKNVALEEKNVANRYILLQNVGRLLQKMQ